MNEPMRLQKYLASHGVCSRRQGEQWILAARVAVNGVIITELGTKVDPDRDLVTCDGKTIQESQERIVLALHKPVGYVTSKRRHTENDPIVMELLAPEYQHLFPIGRLDKDSAGLLLFTNDGKLTERLTHPRFDHSKSYEVLLNKKLDAHQWSLLKQGKQRVLGKDLKPYEVQKLSENHIRIVLTEGRNRQIRRLIRNIGNGVEALNRIAVGALNLDDLALKEGKYKVLNQKQILLLTE